MGVGSKMNTIRIRQHSYNTISKTSMIHVQWNPSIAATLGEQHFGPYTGVAFIEGLSCTQTVHLGPGFLAVIQRWPLFRGGR